MNVVNVYKNAAGFVYELDFSVGATSWSFISQHTGKLVKAVTTNITSYQIGGNVVTYPFQLTKDTSYGISIVPINAGLPATIKFYADDIDYFSSVLSIPNPGIYSGRYLYVLSNNSVLKLDVALLVPSNYSGAGAWIVNPILSTITLPALPASTYYTTITFVKNGGVPKMFIQGSTPSTFKVYACFLNLNDDTVWNIDQTIQNAYTQLFNSTLIYNSAKVAIYDYINEKVYIALSSGNNGSTTFSLNLHTGAVNDFGYNSDMDYLFKNSGLASHRCVGFIPEQQLFCNTITIWDPTPFSKCWLMGNVAMKMACYNKLTGRVITQGNNALAQFREYNLNGRYIVGFNCSGGTLSGNGAIIAFNSSCNEVIMIATTSTVNNYCIYKKGSSSGNGYIFQNVPSGMSYGDCIMKTYYNNTWFCRGNASAGLKRLFVIKSTEVIPDFGYLDFANDIQDMATNQLYD